jgi:hypothetical protein
MDQAVRNKLRNVVTQCRKLLEDATGQALQGRFGIYAARKKGEVQIEDEARMAHLTEEDRACRQDLLDHLAHIQAIGYKPSDALEQLVREIAFTHLNRLCAYKMMEARGLIREAVSRGLKSQGFFFYLADHPDDEKLHKNGQQEVAYRKFLNWLGGTLSEEIGVLFNPNDPANRIYPPQRVLDNVLALINDTELKDIWSQDETIGWVYQYFTPKELRDKARKESQAPRNSYELAFRNQFFTPRYVVEFLTDNTLGRTWYEMRKGDTVLKDRCRYLVRRPTEIFLKEEEGPPAEPEDASESLSQEELLKQPVYIPHRPKKEPREIKILDPACGSGHFLLYCFDLLQVIYEEAYDDPDLGTILRKDYATIDDLRQAAPGLILKYNLHGIDIDLRATQIAALALWLRCQRAYQVLGLKNNEKPKITRSNIVCAEPMPGETDLLTEFTATLQPKVLGQLVESVFKKMKLAGEAGSLLKIEEEIREAASKARDDYIKWKKQQKEAAGFLIKEVAPKTQPDLLDFADLNDEAFLDQAEEEIVAALRQYVEKTSNGKAFRRRLFVEDAARGFALIDLCHKRFDAILMNPPFGNPSQVSKDYIVDEYSECKEDIDAAFVLRGIDLLGEHGFVGAIINRTQFFKSSLRKWRESVLLSRCSIETAADLGFGVLDALVETAAYSVRKPAISSQPSLFFRLLKQENKGKGLLSYSQILQKSTQPMVDTFSVLPVSFFDLPESRISYSASTSLRANFKRFPQFEGNTGRIRQGLATADNFRFIRLVWEVAPDTIGSSAEDMQGDSPRRWAFFAKGGEYSPVYADIHLLVNWESDGEEMKNWASSLYNNSHWSRIIKNVDCYFLPGLTFPRRTASGFGPQVLPPGCIFDAQAPSVLFDDYGDILPILGILVSKPIAALIEALVASGDAVTSGSAARTYEVGIIGSLPIPELPDADRRTLGTHVRQMWMIRQTLDSGEETGRYFTCPTILADSPCNSLVEAADQVLQKYEANCIQTLEVTKAVEERVQELFRLDCATVKEIEQEFGSHPQMLPNTLLTSQDELALFQENYEKDLRSLIANEVGSSGGSRSVTKKCFYVDRRLELLCAIHRCAASTIIDARRKLKLLPGNAASTETARLISYAIGSSMVDGTFSLS